jgi:hypothetical protein
MATDVSSKFAKHMKVDDQVAFLQGHKTGIGVGTPARLIELIDNGKCTWQMMLPADRWASK